MLQTRRIKYNIVNHGTGNIDENDTPSIVNDVDMVEIIDYSDETTLEEVSISIISALFKIYYTFHLQLISTLNSLTPMDVDLRPLFFMVL